METQLKMAGGGGGGCTELICGSGTKKSFSDCYLHLDHVLAVHLDKLLVDQYAVPGGGGVLDDGGDAAVLEDKANVTRAVLLHGKGAVERPAKMVRCQVY